MLGIGAVIWIFLADKKTPAPTPPPKTANGLLTTSQILNQLGLNEDPEILAEGLNNEDSAQDSESPNSQEFITASPGSPKTVGTASLRLGPDGAHDVAEKRLIAQNEQLKRDINEMQSKNEKLETLLNEKNKEIEEVTKDLEVELKSRKEFNKVKDILEKELKDSKEKNRSLQTDLAQTQTEADSYLKRVKQLEEKIRKLDGEVSGKTGELREQQTETEQQQKNLEILDKKLKGLDPVIAGKDQKINAIVPLLKDLPEATPSSRPPEEEKPITGEDQKGGGGHSATPTETGKASPAPNAPSQEAKTNGSLEQPTSPPQKIDDVDRIRRLASADNPITQSPLPVKPADPYPQPTREDKSPIPGLETESNKKEISLPGPGNNPASAGTQSRDQGVPADRTPKDLLETIEADMPQGKTALQGTQEPGSLPGEHAGKPGKNSRAEEERLSDILTPSGADGHSAGNGRPHLAPDIAAENLKEEFQQGDQEAPPMASQDTVHPQRPDDQTKKDSDADRKHQDKQ